jgi:predicted SnoaL-like aldol condensation-catalyzing enzyme
MGHTHSAPNLGWNESQFTTNCDLDDARYLLEVIKTNINTMSNLTFTGRFLKTFNEKSGEGKKGPWRSVGFVLTTDDQYNPNMAFTTMKLVDEVKALQAGQEVTVHYDIRCNEYNNNYYTSLDAWKIETGAVATPYVVSEVPQSADNQSDLPF